VTNRVLLGLTLSVCFSLVWATAAPASAKEALAGPLAEYLAKPDGSYKWVQRSEGKVNATKYVELTLTSQTWRNIVWRHQLFILLPSSAPANADHALFFIGGGRWSDDLAGPPTEGKMPGEAKTFALVAEMLKTPVVVLLQVPQQPIFGGKVEDEIIAYTFDKYLHSGDDEWPLLLPMVKSAVRGMDAVQEFSEQTWKHKIDTFTVSGASKRGWTTWLTGASDERAIAIAPMVIDVLNMGPQMKHQKETWGDLSEQVSDYKELRLDQALETPRGKELLKIVDPYAYRARLTQPKIVILGTNDRYWPLDALNLYWKDLGGQKNILYVPNNGHGLKDLPRLVGAIHALQQQAITGHALPKLSWEHQLADGGLTLSLGADRKPAAARAWIATSATKDFRDSKWEAVELDVNGEKIAHHIDFPTSGYAAMFGELEFKDLDIPLLLSSQVKIVGPVGAE
jgi:PhoPQ-activated pathogenicity-related protein